MMGTEQTGQISLPTTEIRRSIKHLMGIANPIRTDTENLMDSTIQPTIVQLNWATATGHIDQNHSLLGTLDSGTDVPRSGRNIDNHTEMNPQGPIMNTIPKSNRANNCNIFNLVIRNFDLTNTGSLWNGTMKSKSENLVENHGGKKTSKMMSAKIISKLKKLGAKIL